MHVLVTGAGGMLGQAVVQAARERDYAVTATTRRTMDIAVPAQVMFTLRQSLPTVVTNCAGIAPGNGTPLQMVRVNALGPHILADLCARYGVRLIHMSTDCVFHGRTFTHGHDEHETPSPDTDYGRTKLSGEVTYGNCLTVRGSFVGFANGLLAWLLQQHGQIDGWAQARWNGLTVQAMAEVLVELAAKSTTGLIHVPGPVQTKYHLLMDVVQALHLPVTVRPVERPWINRTLRSVYWNSMGIPIPDWETMFREMIATYRTSLEATGDR